MASTSSTSKKKHEVAFPKGVSQPATRALNGAGYYKLEELTKATESELMALHGFGPKALTILRAALAEKGLAFAAEKAK
ncbi:MAG: DNA-binding protein [Anaerolineae bacterium]|nr:DNA-binding protein [Anaerolineae bacterium]